MPEGDRSMLGLIVDMPMTEAAAEAIGRLWLAEDPDRPRPIAVVYRDVEGNLVYGPPIDSASREEDAK